MERILIGSRAFFGGYDDFSNDFNRYLELVENPTFPLREEISLRGVYTVRYKDEAVKKMIDKSIESGDPLSVGIFLVPEVVKAKGIRVNDILRLETLLPKLDVKHQYIATLFNAVKENNSFNLTKEQLDTAYEVYKESRADKYSKEPEEILMEE